MAEDCGAEVRTRLLSDLRAQAPAGNPHSPPRLFDAAPRNALVVPFLHACFPDATFIYVHRPPADALAEALVLWRTGSATTYPALPGWTGAPWSFLLVPGWRDLIGRPLAEIVTEQWIRTMRILITDLEALSPERWCVVDHDTLVADPHGELDRLLGFVAIDPVHAATAVQAQARHPALTAAEIGIARGEIAPYLSRVEALADRARDWIAIGRTSSRRP